MPNSKLWSHSGYLTRRVWIMAAGLVLLCPGVPAAEQAGVGEETPVAVGGAPGPEDRLRHAQALARSGELDAALAIYQQLSARYPDNVDYLFGEAQIHFWAGDTERALQRATRARQLAPNYEDVWRLEHQILKALPASNNERRLREFRAAASSRFPGASWLQSERDLQSATCHWEAGVNRESLDNGADDWQSIYLYLDRQAADDSVVSLTLTEHRRFSLIDHEVAFGTGVTVASSWLLNGTLRFGPNAEFLAETVVDAGLGRVLGDGWIAGIDLGYRRYADDSVDTWGVNVERYFGRFRAAYQLDNTRLASASSFTHRGILNYFADSGSRYGLTIAAGDEVEVVAPGQLLNMDISAVALSGQHPVGERLSILWRVGTHRQGSIYRRNHVGLSIAGEF